MRISELAHRLENISDSLNTSSVLQITDTKEVLVSGFKKIVSVDESYISLKLRKNNCSVTGTDMKIQAFPPDGLVISGKIKSVELL